MTERTRTIRWRAADGGLEHLSLRITDSGVTAEGVVVGGTGETAYGLRYRLVADAGWTAVRSLHLTLLGGPTLALRHDGYGEWTDQEGKKRKEFSGLLDLALAASPVALTGTLLRQAWKAGKTIEIETLAIGAPDFAPARTSLAVACREAGKRWTVADAEVTVDEDGIVATWAGRFERA